MMMMKIAAALLLVLLAVPVVAQEIPVIDISPERPTTATPVVITITGFCYGEVVRNGNVFSVPFGPTCIPEPITVTERFNVGRLEAGNYEVRIVAGDDPDTTLATRAFAVAQAVQIPTLNEYAAMGLALLIAAIALRRMS